MWSVVDVMKVDCWEYTGIRRMVEDGFEGGKVTFPYAADASLAQAPNKPQSPSADVDACSQPDWIQVHYWVDRLYV